MNRGKRSRPAVGSRFGRSWSAGKHRTSAQAPQSFQLSPYLSSLIASINDGAKAAQTGALFFAFIGLYLRAVALSTSDEDLLRERTVAVSQLGMAVPVVFSFAVAPLIFLFLHVHTLIRYDMLAANVQRFTAELRDIEREEDRERCRHILANVEFLRLRGAPSSRTLTSRLFRLVNWFIIAFFPVMVLLFIQLSALRYQSESIIWTQRFALFADLLLLVWFFHRHWRMRQEDEIPFWRKMAQVARFAVWIAPIVAFNLAWMGVPGPDAKTVGPGGAKADYKNISLAAWQPVDQLLCEYLSRGCRYLALDHRLLVANTPPVDSMRNLRLGNATTRTGDLATVEGLFLRGRTLRFADFEESRLYAADLINSDLSGASFRGAHMAGARAAGAIFTKSDLPQSDLSTEQLQSFDRQMSGIDLRDMDFHNLELDGADLTDAKLQHAYLARATLKHAKLDRADLQYANLESAQLQGAILNQTQLQGAILNNAQLQGARLAYVRLQGVVLRNLMLTGLSWVNLEGANLESAQLQGAILNHAQLQGAILNNAQLQGARLEYVQLEGAQLRNADLRGAFLGFVVLYGADLRNAQLQATNLQWVSADGADLRNTQMQGALLRMVGLEGADLRSAALWQAHSPFLELSTWGHSDVRGVTFSEPTAEQRKMIIRSLNTIPNETLRKETEERVKEALTPQSAKSRLKSSTWMSGPMLVDHGNAKEWESIDPAMKTVDVAAYERELTRFLAKRAETDVFAEGIAWRVIHGFSDEPDRTLYPDLAQCLLEGRQARTVKLPDDIARKLEPIAASGKELGTDIDPGMGY